MIHRNPPESASNTFATWKSAVRVRSPPQHPRGREGTAGCEPAVTARPRWRVCAWVRWVPGSYRHSRVFGTGEAGSYGRALSAGLKLVTGGFARSHRRTGPRPHRCEIG